MLIENVPATRDRVPLHTADEINERIKTDTMAKIEYYRKHKDQIDKRLGELDREWDTERMLEAMASSFVSLGVFLGFTRSRNWLLLPGIVGSFLLQHALQGWCPPLPVIRRLGFRTADEINQERMALQCLRNREKTCDLSMRLEQ